jgi:hypothetical protein
MVKTCATSVVCFESLCSFLDELVRTNGESIEKASLVALGGSSIAGSGREVGRLLEDLVLHTVASVHKHLGSVWTSPKEQGHGQPAFESKPLPGPKSDSMSSQCLPGILSLLQSLVEICPVFLLQLPALPGIDRDDDMLFSRAIDSALSSLNESDSELVSHASKFLRSAVSSPRLLIFLPLYAPSINVYHVQATLTQSQNETLRAFVTDTAVRVRADAISYLLQGCCGRYEYSLIRNVSKLLYLLLIGTAAAETEAYLVTVLRQDFFLLGDESKNVTLHILTGCSNHALSLADLTVFLEDMWEIHQAEDMESLPSSDAVARFARKYRT